MPYAPRRRQKGRTLSASALRVQILIRTPHRPVCSHKTRQKVNRKSAVSAFVNNSPRPGGQSVDESITRVDRGWTRSECAVDESGFCRKLVFVRREPLPKNLGGSPAFKAKPASPPFRRS